MVPELKEFEDGLLKLSQDIEFKSINKPFQKQLHRDIINIKKSNKLLVAADKTTNFYKVEPTKYKKLMNQNITKDYKKVPASHVKRNTTGDKNIATKLDLSARGVLYFGLDGGVPPGPRDPNPCLEVKKVPMFRDFAQKMDPCLGIF